MQRIGTFCSLLESTKRRSKVTTAVALARASLFFLVGIQIAIGRARRAVTQATTNTGFSSPYSGKLQSTVFGPRGDHEPTSTESADWAKGGR